VYTIDRIFYVGVIFIFIFILLASCFGLPRQILGTKRDSGISEAVFGMTAMCPRVCVLLNLFLKKKKKTVISYIIK
jgi:hypothetical protein